MFLFARILVFFCFFYTAVLHSEINIDPRGDQSLNNWSRYASVHLEIERNRFNAGEEIPVQIKVKNKGYQTVRIYPYEKPNQSFQFFLSDRQGREIPQDFDPAAWKKREKGARVIDLQGERNKEIILGPEESFEKILYLNDFYDLKPNRNYRLWLYFYPGKGKLFARSQNLVTFRIIEKRTQQKKRGLLYPKKQNSLKLSPEETVYLFLSAEMQKNWSDYLKYLDLKKYIVTYSNYASRYAEAEAQERDLVLEEFSTFLTSEASARLKKFRLLGAEAERSPEGNAYQDERYIVRAMGLREEQGFLRRYEYYYTLEPQNGGFWKIVHARVKLIR